MKEYQIKTKNSNVSNISSIFSASLTQTLTHNIHTMDQDLKALYQWHVVKPHYSNLLNIYTLGPLLGWHMNVQNKMLENKTRHL